MSKRFKDEAATSLWSLYMYAPTLALFPKPFLSYTLNLAPSFCWSSCDDCKCVLAVEIAKYQPPGGVEATVAVKRLKSNATLDISQFASESNLLRKLHHAYVYTIHVTLTVIAIPHLSV